MMRQLRAMMALAFFQTDVPMLPPATTMLRRRVMMALAFFQTDVPM
jgi:hypothetical protein